ncbi:hypothetical protein HO173_001194 [Letharia columbiana]|uniref:Uncharacterized protein n=1 Tax=Letharia columbiana TaxID=112416 RepID=A0A8H6G4T1_9LECA|nr:uncharacterized protein HO173_001194 [Letharia columbiana]KAF6240526.1 hypothetical protein HO173_001194 [Letharia columbiana]
MSASNFLQLQTRAAYPPGRPQIQPDKDIQFGTSRSSSTSASSPRSSPESSPSHSPSTDWARCSRCHRSVSVDGSLPSMTGVSFGTNSYYCQRSRPAIHVGLLPVMALQTRRKAGDAMTDEMMENLLCVQTRAKGNAMLSAVRQCD